MPSKFPAPFSITLYLALLGALNLAAFAHTLNSNVETDAVDLVRVAGPKPTYCGVRQDLSLTSYAAENVVYKLTVTYFTLREGLSTTLMLNNKGSGPIVATPTIYSLAGTRLSLAPITVPAASYLDVDMHQLLAGQSDEFREGSMKISYEDAENDLIWAEQFVYSSKFVSSRLENVWWLPFEDSKTRVVVSNTSGATVTASITVDGTTPQQNTPLQISLAPW